MKWKELHIKIAASVFALVVVLSTFAPLNVNAANNPYRFNVAVNEPSSDLYSGYLTISSGNDWTCFYWRVSPAIYDNTTNVDIESCMNIDINGSSITFTAKTNHLGYVSLRETDINGLSNLLMNKQFDTTTSHTVNMGSTVQAYSVKGQYVQVFGNDGYNYNSVTTLWAPENIIKTAVTDSAKAIENISSNILTSVNRISTKLSESNVYLENIELYSSLMKSYQQSMHEIMVNMNSVINLIGSRTYTMVNRLDSITERTYRIMTDLAEFKDGMLNESEEDKAVTDKLEEDSKNHQNELETLTEESKTEQVDIDSTSAMVDGVIDGNAIANYGIVLQIFTNNDYIFKCLLFVVTVGLIGYVLFGKK